MDGAWGMISDIFLWPLDACAHTCAPAHTCTHTHIFIFESAIIEEHMGAVLLPHSICHFTKGLSPSMTFTAWYQIRKSSGRGLLCSWGDANTRMPFHFLQDLTIRAHQQWGSISSQPCLWKCRNNSEECHWKHPLMENTCFLGMEFGAHTYGCISPQSKHLWKEASHKHTNRFTLWMRIKKHAAPNTTDDDYTSKRSKQN